MPVFILLVGTIWLIGETKRTADLQAPIVLQFGSARSEKDIVTCLAADDLESLPLRKPKRAGFGRIVDPFYNGLSLYNPVWSIYIRVSSGPPTQVTVRRTRGALAERHRRAILHCR